MIINIIPAVITTANTGTKTMMRRRESESPDDGGIDEVGFMERDSEWKDVITTENEVDLGSGRDSEYILENKLEKKSGKLKTTKPL